MPQTSIIFLNGPSSAGKTTLGRALQRILETPYFYFSSDQLVEARVLPAVDRSTQVGVWAWQNLRPSFFAGFHRCIAALASAGNPLIVEHVLEAQSWLEECVELLATYDVYFVGVHCQMNELERRERERGDRTIGEGRSHLEDGVHSWGSYDFEIDTSLCDTERNARLVRDAFAARRAPSAFQRMLNDREGRRR